MLFSSPVRRCCCSRACAPTPGGATSSSCNGSNQCVANCDASHVDLDGVWSNGCECFDDGGGADCGHAVGFGDIHIGGGGNSRTGTLPRSFQQDWFLVNFPDAGNQSYHPSISLSSTDGNIVMDVFNGCGGAYSGCPEQGSGATAIKGWESYVANNASLSIPLVGSGGTMAIRVYRLGGGVSCTQYTLSVSD
jgi:hypothetical protein